MYKFAHYLMTYCLFILYHLLVLLFLGFTFVIIHNGWWQNQQV
jgi:hypothetical protein